MKTKLRQFLVAVREVHVQQVRVKAESPEDAKERVVKGEGDQVDDSLEYSHTLDSDLWTVEEEVAPVHGWGLRSAERLQEGVADARGWHVLREDREEAGPGAFPRDERISLLPEVARRVGRGRGVANRFLARAPGSKGDESWENALTS